MALLIESYDETNSLSEEHLALAEEVLQKAAEMEGIHEEAEVSLTFVTDERIQEINREYRDKDQPTDVISFALEEQGEDEMMIVGADMPRILGDIIISIPRIQEQADAYNHSFERELGFLAVHGFLHLLGYDHMTEEEEKEMFQRQKDILNQYGLTR
ncbi:rRNA maturation RNase YbeY [Bacillus taeanensis]|uniref:Endoribonuclease YbeY n=1 Tax=Bacillus taeanensis TaxID=273032 RepID=A0A366XVT6_9BACI|nr:rRNA maturation RNase YbeY [Bacillus taeanensis]RBW70510.1 rRNA maturation RNase YbeY [Bacillus taeanensis]